MMNDDQHFFVGVDACKGGWIAALLRKNQLEIQLYKTIEGLWKDIGQQQILIDIPIGLLENEEGNGIRLCDQEARMLLSHKSSSVFPVPCRQAVYIDKPEQEKHWYKLWHQQVNRVNQEIIGKGLPIQSLGIIPKTRAVDELLSASPEAINYFWESHPELGFLVLNRWQALQHSKKTIEGVQERTELIQSYLTAWGISQNSETFLSNEFPKSKVAKDDILDAICLAIHSKLGQLNGFIALGKQTDPKGIPMNITYGNC